MIATETETEQQTTREPALLRHIVELDEDGQPADKCLCGHLWDRVFVNAGPVCEECLKELRRRERAKG